MPRCRAILLGLALQALPAWPMRATSKKNAETQRGYSGARLSLRARYTDPDSSRLPTINLLICQSARDFKQLRLLREAWIDEALDVAGIQIRVFMPRAFTSLMTGTDPRLGVTALQDWYGDVSSFQIAMSNALATCEQHSPAARFYAVMDDDMVVKPRELMNWALSQQGVADKESGGFGVWGHEGCCNLVYGGMMLMTQHMVEWIVGNMDYFRSLATEKMLHHANRSLMGIYDGTSYNIDHFFPIAAVALGGVQAVRGTKIIQDQIWDNATLCPWPQDVLVVHHVRDADFRDFIRRTAPGGEGCGQGWPAATRR
mmetsp:Transcript_112762/g.318996  ORF Transcript_112762/g.318996 Transcript_112762/m.318996 type:complete len:314 (+) Transcript_112762:46-987(+)